jgi:hypothetical protein
MLVVCSAISIIVILALFGSTLVAIERAIIAKIARMTWTKTLVDLPTSKLKSELSRLRVKKDGLTFGYLEMSKAQQYDVVSKSGDVEARIRILERLISERDGFRVYNK